MGWFEGNILNSECQADVGSAPEREDADLGGYFELTDRYELITKF